MNPTTSNSPEIRSLVEAVCDGIANDAQILHLQSLLRTSDETCYSYVELLKLDAELQWLIGSRQESGAISNEFVPAPQKSRQPSVLFPPLVHSTIDYFSSGWPLAYLIATVLFGIGALVSSHTYVSHSTPGYERLAMTNARPAILEPKQDRVGRITGMVDCRWERSSEADGQSPNPQSLVSLGDKFSLDAGLMEITYNTGAKVILQGPMTYEVERNGGYLSIGKLAARLEKGEEGRGESKKKVASGQQLVASGQGPVTSESNSKSRNPEIPKSPIPNPFVIHTPTASITDLGTEFGIEVSKEGNTASHVFRGSVSLQPISNSGTTSGREIILRENESAQLVRSAAKEGFPDVVVNRSAIDSTHFVRTIPRSPTRYGSGLITYDGFRTTGSLNRCSPSFGVGVWWTAPEEFTCAAGSLALPIGALSASGGHVCVSAPAASTASRNWLIANRYLSPIISSDVAGNYYLSLVYARGQSDWGLCGLRDSEFDATLVAGMWGDGKCAVDIGDNLNNYVASFGDVIDRAPRLYVMKIVTCADDTANKVRLCLKVFASNDRLTPEPSAWDATKSHVFTSPRKFDRLTLISVNTPGPDAQFDEIRIGTTWESVAGLGPEGQKGGKNTSTHPKGKKPSL